MKTKRYAYAAGLLAATMIAGGAFAAALGYEGYSFLRQNISDLGKTDVSPWSPMFNGGLILGAPLMAVFILSVALETGSRAFYGVALIGLVTTIGMAFVGVFPISDAHDLHVAAASVAFGGTIGLGAAFTAAMLAVEQAVLPIWLIAPGVMSCLSSAAFVVSVVVHKTGLLAERWLMVGGSSRGDALIWWPSLLEWSVLFCILLWASVTAGFLLVREHRADADAPS